MSFVNIDDYADFCKCVAVYRLRQWQCPVLMNDHEHHIAQVYNVHFDKDKAAEQLRLHWRAQCKRLVAGKVSYDSYLHLFYSDLSGVGDKLVSTLAICIMSSPIYLAYDKRWEYVDEQKVDITYHPMPFEASRSRKLTNLALPTVPNRPVYN
jgi:hypothetical protein